MTSGWHIKLARLTRMDWEEIHARLGQELHKRGDLLRHRLGMPPRTIRLASSAGPAPKFFFADGEAQERAKLNRQHLPEQAAEIVSEADEICQHKFRLLGYEDLDYGPEIDWHLDRVHGKRAPLDPWFKIPFLDFAVVGDHKVTWELNRHQHLVTLAKAWRLTKDEKYLHELTSQWHSWSQANPYPLGINWGSTLEVAFRALSWIWVDHLLSDGAPAANGAPGALARHPRHPSDTERFRAELLPALAFHGRYIERYLSTYFSPNTHLLGEAVAMFFLGTLYPQFPRAPRWKNEGWKIILHEAGRQVRPDGVYFEQSLYYHVYALDFFLYARLLAAANNTAVPSAYDETLRKMLDVVEALAQAGPPEGFGDDDGGRLFNARRNRTEHMTDPLAVGALAYQLEELGAAQLTEESIWLFGETAAAKLARDSSKNAATSAAFPDGGLYILGAVATDAPNESQPMPHVMMIDAGPQGVGRCGHGHADALSLRLTMGGSRWLVDSGSGVYISADPADRNAFRGTVAHNTLRVDGADQAVPDEPFSWTNVPTTRAETWVTGKTFTYFDGSHNGYERLQDPVTHRRCVLQLDAGGRAIWLVRDIALGNADHDLELLWHFASDLAVQQTGASEVIASRPNAEPSTLRLIFPEQTSWKTRISQSSVSPAYGRYEPAPLVRSEARVKLPAETATALIAQTRAGRPGQTQSETRLIATAKKAVQVYELQHANAAHGFLFARDKQPWASDPWSSDAELLYYRIENEKLAHLVVIGGSSVAWQGQPLLTASRPSKSFEWQPQSGTMSEGPFSPTPLFDELTRSSLSSNAASSYAEKR